MSGLGGRPVACPVGWSSPNSPTCSGVVGRTSLSRTDSLFQESTS